MKIVAYVALLFVISGLLVAGGAYVYLVPDSAEAPMPDERTLRDLDSGEIQRHPSLLQ